MTVPGLGAIARLSGGGFPAATGVEFLATMTSNSAPSPQVASASNEWGANSLFAWKAFNKSNSGFSDIWSTDGPATGWLAIDTGAATVLWSYSVASRNDGSGMEFTPRDWTLEGSDNNATWTVVDTRTGQTSWTAGQVRSYTLSAGVLFRHYRMNISANNGGGALQVGELRFFS